MCQYIKNGSPWMSLVKTGWENEDYSRVDAYVTSTKNDNKIVVYESVRSCPSRDEMY